MLAAGPAWRPVKEQRPSLCVRVSVQPRKRRTGGEEVEEEAIERGCNCMGQCKVRL